MLVSVVIPCHNSLRYLPQTVDAVLAQRLPAGVTTEVVLVDDGGDDDLTGWANSRLGDRVRVVRQENTGVSGARNRGIDTSQGDLIALCDSDDVWLPNHIADLVACFEADPGIGLAYGWYDVVDDDGRPTGARRRGEMSGRVWEELLLDNPIGASGVMVSRAALDDVGSFKVNRELFPIDVEDWELWLRIARRWPVAVTPNVVYHYRRHDSNSSADIESLEAAYRFLFDTVFGDPGFGEPRFGEPGSDSPVRPGAIAELRSRAEANVAIILAWQSLNDREDPSAALRYIGRARELSPGVTRSWEYWRLRLAAGALRRTGGAGYTGLRAANSALRRARAVLRST